MIEFIEIEGFQSQYNARIDFSEGITAITGKSMEGKTAILRAFELVRTNRPLGTSFLYRYEEMICRISIGIDKHVVTYKKAKKALDKEGNKALYIITYPDGTTKTESVFGTSVPESVSEIINLSNISIQWQLDPYLLVTSTSGEIAKTINKITGIDIGDEWIKEIKKKSSLIKTEKDLLTKSQEDLGLQLSYYSDVDLFKDKLVEAEQLDNDYNSKIKSSNFILDSLNYQKGIEAGIKSNKAKLTKIKGLLDKILKEDRENQNFTQNLALVNVFLRLSKTISAKKEGLKKCKLMLIDILSFQSDLISINQGLKEIKKFKQIISKSEDLKRNINLKKDDLAQKILDSEVCFICGNELTDYEKIRSSL